MNKTLYSIIKQYSFDCNNTIKYISNCIYESSPKSINNILNKQFIKNYIKLLKVMHLSNEEFKQLKSVTLFIDVIKHKKSRLINKIGLTVEDYNILKEETDDYIYFFLREKNENVKEAYLNLKKEYEGIENQNEIKEHLDDEKKAIFYLDDFSEAISKLKNFIIKKVKLEEFEIVCKTEEQKAALEKAKKNKEIIVEEIINIAISRVSGEKLFENKIFYIADIQKPFIDIIRERKIEDLDLSDIIRYIMDIPRSIQYCEIIKDYFNEIKNLIESYSKTEDKKVEDYELLLGDSMPKLIKQIEEGEITPDEMLKRFDDYLGGISYNDQSYNNPYLKEIGLEDLYDNYDSIGYLGIPNITPKIRCKRK